LSGFDTSDTLVRQSLAQLLARHVAAEPDAAGGRVAAAASERLRRWAGVPEETGRTVEDWEHPASVLTCEEFLAPGELAALRDFVLARERAFEAGTLVGPQHDGLYVDRSFRAADTLFDLGPFRDLFERRVALCLPFVCARLGIPPIERHWLEFQLTSMRDGGHFGRHDDNSHPANRTRRLTFVFYFYGSPERPSGGELRFSPKGAWHGPLDVRPLPNRLVFFDSSVTHEVLPVRAASSRFEASRFTVNGWVHQE